MTRTSAFTLILNQGHCYVNAFLFFQILDFNARGGLSNNQEERISLLSITIWESWMAELSGGGKLKREKKGFLDMNFCLWEHETLELYEGLWGNKLHIDFTEFQLPNWQNDAISCDEFFRGKAGHYIVSLFRLLFSALSISNGNRTEWYLVRFNHASDSKTRCYSFWGS